MMAEQPRPLHLQRVSHLLCFGVGVSHLPHHVHRVLGEAHAFRGTQRSRKRGSDANIGEAGAIEPPDRSPLQHLCIVGGQNENTSLQRSAEWWCKPAMPFTLFPASAQPAQL